ncbi:ribonuclease Z [Filimonas lacunae]|uniref:Ribonuclease Z n=1 Tax=Filimonas lacunae TaxID=477680 RepID=A0A173MK86_9BACT|nr:ribonuclease Z [Filimonas lacunae]BAV07887.1 ribonuclease Z [Filimonas lacunae]SIT06028.1 ribonuclease Z [Filimonas lacunae]
MFGVTILGNNSALPAYDRHPTAQVITLNEQIFLIDCGEGTQMQLSRFKVRRGRINHIFISHLHGDHYFGLPGLITSMGLMGRDNELHIYAPAKLEEIIQLQLDVSGTALPFRLHFHILGDDAILVDNTKYTIESFRVFHRIDCWGFLIKEKKKPRRIDKDKAIAHEVPLAYYERLKNGDDYETRSGEVVKNEWVTTPNTPGKSYAYCADTKFDASIAARVKGVSMLYHETTYLKNLPERAFERFHSTTEQAAEIATLAQTQKLLIGHFSSKYEVLDEFLAEASAVFPNTDLALEGVTYLVP